MKMNANNDISIYRGETGAIDFKISQRSDYYVPFLISNERINPMVCITIGSTRRESKNIVTKQIWVELTTLPTFSQTTVEDLGIIDDTGMTLQQLKDYLATQLMSLGIMYQFTRKTEVDADNSQLHFAYESSTDVGEIDNYDFTVVMPIDEDITLDMTSTDYFYQIELMNTELMLDNLIATFADSPALINKVSAAFAAAYAINAANAINTHLAACITAVTKTYPNHWGHRITNPLTSPVASVSIIQIIQPPRNFIVQSVVK